MDYRSYSLSGKLYPGTSMKAEDNEDTEDEDEFVFRKTNRRPPEERDAAVVGDVVGGVGGGSVETEKEEPAPPKTLERKSSVLLLAGEAIRVNVIRMRAFKKESTWCAERALSHAFSFDLLMFKLFVSLGGTVFDSDDFRATQFSYFAAFYPCTESEWADYQSNWASLTLQLPRCAWVQNGTKGYRLTCTGDFFYKLAFSLVLSIHRYFRFLKAGLGFWDLDSLQCLVETKILNYQLDAMMVDGYGDQLLASVMMPRAGLLRIFPLMAPLSLFIQQMSTTPSCFLVPCWHNCHPLYEQVRTSCLRATYLEETERWALILLTPVTFYDDHFLLRYLINFVTFATAVCIAFAPKQYWNILITTSVSCFLAVGFLESLRALVQIMGRAIGLTDQDFRIVFCREKWISKNRNSNDD